jgi:hypothetical protein
MPQTMFAHVNKWINKQTKKSVLVNGEKTPLVSEPLNCSIMNLLILLVSSVAHSVLKQNLKNNLRIECFIVTVWKFSFQSNCPRRYLIEQLVPLFRLTLSHRNVCNPHRPLTCHFYKQSSLWIIYCNNLTHVLLHLMKCFTWSDDSFSIYQLSFNLKHFLTTQDAFKLYSS